MKTTSAIILLSATMLTGCQTVGGWIDSAGRHMPTIGDRCENWQCFTSSGQATSDARKAQYDAALQKAKEEEEAAKAAEAGAPPAGDTTNSTDAPLPMKKGYEVNIEPPESMDPPVPSANRKAFPVP